MKSICNFPTVIIGLGSLAFACWAVVFVMWVEYGWTPWKKEQKKVVSKNHQSSPPVEVDEHGIYTK